MKLRIVNRACEMRKPIGEQWTVVQREDTGLIVGNIGPNSEGKPGFIPDGCTYTLSAEALREIADLIGTRGLALAVGGPNETR